MKKNMGKLDKQIRLVVGVVLIGLSILDVVTGPLAIAFIVVALVLLATVILGTCPLYIPFGINTCKTGEDEVEKP